MSITRNNYWRSRKGLRYEELAITHLQQQGLCLLQRNFRCATGEIDLIMQHRHVLVFVEVRFRGNPDYGGAVATITRDKQQKLLRTARFFLLCHKEHQQRDCRFDVVGITPGPSGGSRFDWIQDAFC
jgi:putative endonuclease